MKKSRATLLVSILAALTSVLGAAEAQSTSLPHLERRGEATQLIVDGAPFLMLAGETHNSSFSSAAYLQRVWPRLAGMHLNTVLVPVAWEMIEPQEGRFDFSTVDSLIKGARDNKLRLVFLWFGSWKNTYSSYVPAWVKQDLGRFPRVQMSDGSRTERISPLSATASAADARAFGQLMRHLRKVDGDRHTILFLQVENEVGVIPQSRDHSPAAEAAFTAPVPTALMQYIVAHRAALQPNLRAAWEAAGARTSGTWQQVFGDASLTDHLFMSWWYATYIERVAAAGKAEYSMPLYTNAALVRPNYEPGQYNSGGPLPQSLDIWKAGAQSLDFLSPDIYFDDFAFWASAYSRSDNPLFVPETRGGPTGSANSLYALGALDAIGFSPFGIEGPDSDSPPDTDVGNMYGLLAGLSPLILKKQSEGSINALVMEGEAQRSGRVRVGNFIANMSRAGGPTGAVDPATRVAALFLQTGPTEFIVAGSGDAQITFTSDKPGVPTIGVESIDEQIVTANGALTAARRLNGDETGQGQLLRLHGDDAAKSKVYKIRLYQY